MRCTPVERDRFDRTVRGEMDRAARRFVNAARFHADETVFDQIETADAVVVAEFVELREQRRGRKLVAVDGDGIALFETDLHGRRFVRRFHRRDGALIDDIRRFDVRIFEHFSFGRRVQEVRIDRERRFAFLTLGNRDLVIARKCEQVFAALEFPFAPRRDDLDAGLERVIAELEAHLIVALAGGAMRHRIRAGFARDLDLLLCDQRPRDRGAEKIKALVLRVGAEHREDVIAHELLAHVLDEDVFFLDAGAQRFFARGRKLAALAEIGGEGDDLAVIGRLQPFQDDRGVEAAGIGEHHLLYALRHVTLLVGILRRL